MKMYSKIEYVGSTNVDNTYKYVIVKSYLCYKVKTVNFNLTQT